MCFCRKAVKAGVVLVPLMGIANLVQSTYWPLEMNIIQLGNLSYLVTTLISFQGFFCSLIYCFLNRQVKQSLKRFFKDWKARITTTRQNPNASPDAFFVVPNPTPFGAMVDSPDRIRRNQRSRSEELRKHKQQRTFGGSVGKRKVKVVGEGAGVDPFFEHWSDVELSAHNNVDIEQIEIPLQYFAQGPNTVHSNIDTAYSKLATSSRTAQSTSMDARISHVDLNSPGSSSNKACQRGQRGQAQGQVRSILSKIDISRPQLPHNADQQIME
ncbi:PDF receptor [Folsomia candida]|uniref:PDF receptor n=1 Tax=Folsomia candida TaxID=158441 RepID=A0A226EZR9_FOLCA|nr:PDF receptor [Folsomia candida]